MSLMDTGSSDILVRYDELVAIAKLFNGPVIFQNQHDLYYDCSIPQLLELRYNDQWFPVDPLDILNPNDHGNVNGTEMYVLTLYSFQNPHQIPLLWSLAIEFLDARNIVSQVSNHLFLTAGVRPRSAPGAVCSQTLSLGCLSCARPSVFTIMSHRIYTACSRVLDSLRW